MLQGPVESAPGRRVIRLRILPCLQIKGDFCHLSTSHCSHINCQPTQLERAFRTSGIPSRFTGSTEVFTLCLCISCRSSPYCCEVGFHITFSPAFVTGSGRKVPTRPGTGYHCSRHLNSFLLAHSPWVGCGAYWLRSRLFACSIRRPGLLLCRMEPPDSDCVLLAPRRSIIITISIPKGKIVVRALLPAVPAMKTRFEFSSSYLINPLSISECNEPSAKTKGRQSCLYKRPFHNDC